MQWRVRSPLSTHTAPSCAAHCPPHRREGARQTKPTAETRHSHAERCSGAAAAAGRRRRGPPRARLVAGGAAVDVVEAVDHLAQRADGPLLAQEALHVPRAQEEPGRAYTSEARARSPGRAAGLPHACPARPARERGQEAVRTALALATVRPRAHARQFRWEPHQWGPPQALHVTAQPKPALQPRRQGALAAGVLECAVLLESAQVDACAGAT